MANETFLLTGSMGCIGSWVIRLLIDEGVRIIATDLDTNPVRPALLMTADELKSVHWEGLDVTDGNSVAELVKRHEVTHIVHLAGLQIPFCRANPSLGAAVNVQGTVNVFEAALHNGVKGLTYASSVGVLGPAALYPERPVKDDVPLLADTLYGVYKACNEQTARIYWQDSQLGSVGLRPYNVYGVGRDQGMTSDIAKSILATAAGQPYHIRYNGPLALQHAKDVAQSFIDSARLEHQGASACNMRNDVMDVEDFIALLVKQYPQAQVTCAEQHLPFPADLDDSNLQALLGKVPHTPMSEAIDQDIAMYTKLIEQKLIDLGQLAQ